MKKRIKKAAVDWDAVKSYIEGTKSLAAAAEHFGLNRKTLSKYNSRKWRIKCKYGIRHNGLCRHCGSPSPTKTCRSCLRFIHRTVYKPLLLRPPYAGERHHWWKGGKTKTAEFIRFTPPYKKWRKDVFERDNYTCQECGARSSKGNPVVLHAHHRVPQSLCPSMRFDLRNGATLCKPCHIKTGTYLRGTKGIAAFVVKIANYWADSPCEKQGFKRMSNREAFIHSNKKSAKRVDRKSKRG